MNCIEFKFDEQHVTPVDLDSIAVGPEGGCRQIVLEGKSYLEVSRPIDFKIPADLKRMIGRLCKSCIVGADQPLRPDGTRICFWAVYDEQGPSMALDMGTTFPGDKGEFGHYVLWNPKTGKLSISEELDLSR